MRISQLILCDHIRLKVSKIKEIELNIDADTQLIVGSNGSGKSSILHELFPFPSVKSSFGKLGSKQLCLTHNNAEYRLTYESGVGHLFFKDGVNLNISNTNEIQKDLIKEHFGITNEIHMILKCALPICDMLPSQRKKILMNMNPIDLSVFLEKYHKVHKDVVAYGNNLDRLYSRQKQLMMQRIPDQQYQTMLQRKLVLENQEKILLVWITTVTNELEKYPEVTGISIVPDDHIIRIKNLFKLLPSFNTIRAEDCDSNIVKYKTQSDIIRLELKELETSIGSIITQLNDYEEKKKLLIHDESSVAEELSQLMLKQRSFQFESNFNPIPESQFDDVSTIINNISTVLINLSYITYSEIASQEQVNELYRKELELKAETNQIVSNISRLEKQYDEIKKSIRLFTISDRCSVDECELLASYVAHKESRESKLSELTQRIKALRDELTVTTTKYQDIKMQYDLQVNIWSHVYRVIQAVHTNETLKRHFDTTLIIDRIRESPMLLIQDVQYYLQQSTAYIEYTTTMTRIRELEVLNASISSKKQLSLEVLNAEITNQVKQLDDLRIKHQTREYQLHETDARFNHHSQFKRFKESVYTIQSELGEIEQNAQTKASREYLYRLLNILSNLLSNIRSELVDITSISKEQELLIGRLDKEVDAVIAELKPKYEQAKHIEKALFELPIKYTKTFINDIIETTNYFINEIATYPIRLVPVGENEECDFNFPAKIKDVPTKDISTCSEGQKAIIQLAFNLAMVVELKFNDYPVYCDESTSALDPAHSRRLVDLLLNLVANGITSQLFTVNHDEAMIERLSGTGQIIVLNGENINLPANYNENVKITYE